MVLDEDMNNSSHNFDSFSTTCWPIQSTPQVNVVEALGASAGLGLKLTVTPPFLEKLYRVQLAQTQKNYYNAGEPSNSSAANFVYAKSCNDTSLQHQHAAANKIKAENFPIALLRIGSWQRVSRNEGDLVAKCYFAKRKLVWEFLEKGLKSKIEIQWSDILSLRAIMHEDQHGVLEIELNQPPSFHHEIDPQPRKHTQWRMVSDFTGGQAPTFRRHYLEFPYGALNKPLEKLLRCDNRLFQLSRQPFPTLDSPYFDKQAAYFSLDFGGQPFSFSNVAPHFHADQQTYHDDHQKPQKPLNFNDSRSPLSDENTSNQIGGMPSLAAAAASVPHPLVNNNPMPAGYFQEPIFVHHNHHMPMPPSYVQDPISLHQAERQLQNLLSKSDQFPDWMVEDNLSRQGFFTNCGQNVVDSTVVVISNNFSTNTETLMYPQSASAAAAASSWPQSQIPDENLHVNRMPGNNALYSSLHFDPTIGYFSNFQ